MLRLLGIVLSIGLADSVNPATVAPALYLASVKDPIRRVLSFTLGVFAVMVLAGAIVALGPGQLLLHLVPHPRHIVEYWLEVIAGAVLLAIGLVLWRFRVPLAARDLIPSGADEEGKGRSSLLLGAGIMLVELPTAFPYFAALAAIIGSGRPLAAQLPLIFIYDVCFVLPLLGIAAVLRLAPGHSENLLTRARCFIQEHWPEALATVLLLAGLFCLALGITGVAAHDAHNRFGHLAGHLHHIISHP